MKQVNSDNFTGLNQFVVDPSAAYGAFTTIQEAVNAAFANAGGTVAIRHGTYVENVTMSPDVYLIGDCVDQSNKVVISGTLSFPDIAGDSGIESLSVQAVGATPAISVTKTAASVFNLTVNGCNLTSNGAEAIVVTAVAGANIGMQIHQSQIDGNTNGIVLTGPGSINLTARDCGINSAAGACFVLGVGANVLTFYSTINSGARGADLNDVTAAFLMINGFGSFTDELITFNAAGQGIVVNSGFSCSAGSGNWAAGAAGTLIYGGLSIVGGSSGIAAGLSQVIADQLPLSTAGTTGTAVRGHVGFDSSTFTVTNGFVQLTGTTTNWVDTTSNQTIVPGTGYAVSAGVISFNLPATAAYGTGFKVSLEGGTSWSINQAAGQSIRLGNTNTTVGAGGSLASTAQGNTISCICDVANTHWFVESVVGNITVV